MDIPRALKTYWPDANWALDGEEYTGLVWGSPDIPKPTILELEAKIAELKAAEPMRLLRKERDRLLAETDWWAVADRTMTDEQSAYRQALRDLPDNSTPVLDYTNKPTYISGVTWPTKP